MRYVTVGPVTDTSQTSTLTVKKFLKAQGYTEHQIRHVKYVPKGLLLNGKPCRAVDPLKPGDVVQVLIEDAQYADGNAVPGAAPQIPWPVLYEDADVLVINKPAGLVVHPAYGHYEDSLVMQLQRAGVMNRTEGGMADGAMGSANTAGGTAENTVRIIGRLDQDTSGVLMLAKNAVAAERLQKQRRDGRLVRTYLAWVHGVPSPRCGIIDKPIGRENPGVNRMTTAEKQVEDGKDAGENVSAMRNLRPAVSHYEVVKDDGETSLVKLYIETGRTHQIRVHMASIGHPLVGDPIYGNGPELGMERTALHASELRWEKPHSGEVCCVKAELPEEIIVGCVYKKNRFIMQKHC